MLRYLIMHFLDIAWSPRQNTLAISAGGDKVYMWTPFGCLTVLVPGGSGLEASVLK